VLASTKHLSMCYKDLKKNFNFKIEPKIIHLASFVAAGFT